MTVLHSYVHESSGQKDEWCCSCYLFAEDKSSLPFSPSVGLSFFHPLDPGG